MDTPVFAVFGPKVVNLSDVVRVDLDGDADWSRANGADTVSIVFRNLMTLHLTGPDADAAREFFRTPATAETGYVVVVPDDTRPQPRPTIALAPTEDERA